MYKCDVCNKTGKIDDNLDIVLYGKWMFKQNVTVHYYCLLLSSKLPQRGGDSSGILGFLLRDIRKEAEAAQARKCAFCQEIGASIFCSECHIVFHLACGLENRCVFQFCDKFLSFCERCAPMDNYKRQLLANPPKSPLCDICFRHIKPFLIHNITYGDCCRKGFAHRTCMRRYALASGYYLRCLWCRSNDFHDTIRLQSIFVPDRDATWELQRDAYHDLHNKRMRCEQPTCLCPKGRNYNKSTWIIQLCVLCAATGTHYKCRVGTPRLTRASTNKLNNFKCDMCIDVEKKLQSKSVQKKPMKTNWETADVHIDTSYYVLKSCSDLDIDPVDEDSASVSDDSTSTDTSVVTVVNSQKLPVISTDGSNEMTVKIASPSGQVAEHSPTNVSIIELSDTQPSAAQQLLHTYLQPPLLLKESFTCGDYFYLVVYEYNENLANPCAGSCTLRFAADDPRLADRSEKALQALQLNEMDIWFHDKDRGIYDKIDKYIN